MANENSEFASVVCKLMDRGLSEAEIDCAMQQTVGNDWRKLEVLTWFARLQYKQILPNIGEIRVERYIDELEKLVRRRTV